MMLKLCCSCGWSLSKPVPEHTLREHLELILREHPQGITGPEGERQHELMTQKECRRLVALAVKRFLAEQEIGIGFKEARCKADGFVLSGR